MGSPNDRVQFLGSVGKEFNISSFGSFTHSSEIEVLFVLLNFSIIFFASIKTSNVFENLAPAVVKSIIIIRSMSSLSSLSTGPSIL